MFSFTVTAQTRDAKVERRYADNCLNWWTPTPTTTYFVRFHADGLEGVECPIRQRGELLYHHGCFFRWWFGSAELCEYHETRIHALFDQITFVSCSGFTTMSLNNKQAFAFRHHSSDQSVASTVNDRCQLEASGWCSNPLVVGWQLARKAHEHWSPEQQPGYPDSTKPVGGHLITPVDYQRTDDSSFHCNVEAEEWTSASTPDCLGRGCGSSKGLQPSQGDSYVG